MLRSQPLAKDSKVQIIFRGYDPRSVETASRRLMDVAKSMGLRTAGPVPFPLSKRESLKVPEASGANKHRSVKVHRRLIDIHNPTFHQIEDLTKTMMPSSIEIEVRYVV